MLLTPSVLALLICGAAVCVIVTAASVVGLPILLFWDPEDSGSRQLARERQMLLVEATVKVALALQLLSLFVFVVTAERLHPLLPGAMCAAGTLNSSGLGYPTLAVKVVVYFLCGLWLIVHRASITAAGAGIVRGKLAFLPILAAALVLENLLQLRFFLELDPEVLTSCCSTIFAEGGRGLGATLARLPVDGSRIAFFGLFGLTMGAGLLALSRHRSVALFSILTPALGLVSLAAIVTWVAPALYSAPSHHCPFCLLSPPYSVLGLLLYGLLALAVVSGAGAGALRALRTIDRDQAIPAGAERRLCMTAVAGFLLFALISVGPVLVSGIRWEGS